MMRIAFNIPLEQELEACERGVREMRETVLRDEGWMLGLADWQGELKILRRIMQEREQMVTDAVRTDANYEAALARLEDRKVLRLLHAAIGMTTEVGEFMDALKKHIFYGRPLDEVNLAEEIGDQTWYQRIAVDALEQRFMGIIESNVAKLRARYPEKFTEHLAENRDLAKERRVLEATNDHPAVYLTPEGKLVARKE